jgi:hypothetical protein
MSQPPRDEPSAEPVYLPSRARGNSGLNGLPCKPAMEIPLIRQYRKLCSRMPYKTLRLRSGWLFKEREREED